MRELEELHGEEMRQLWQHQVEMVCQFWALADAGIKGPGTTMGRSTPGMEMGGMEEPGTNGERLDKGAHRREHRKARKTLHKRNGV